MQNSQNSKPRKKPDASRTYLDSNNNEWTIEVEFKNKKGRVGFHSLTVTSLTDAPITRRLMAELPLDKLFRAEMVAEKNEALSRKIKRNTASQHPGRAHSDEELQLVGEIYISAYMRKVSVEKSVADAFGISVSTASKRISAARSRGFITENMTTRNV